MIHDFAGEYLRYRRVGEKAIEQVSNDDLNRAFGRDNNSIAVIVRHISGNLISRFTDFRTSDGEKPWRDRDSEFEERQYEREEVKEYWARGWSILEGELAKLRDEDLGKLVSIRGRTWTIHDALCRSLAHVAYHIGQIVMLARICAEGDWEWISIPKGKSREYNLDPTKEKASR